MDEQEKYVSTILKAFNDINMNKWEYEEVYDESENYRNDAKKAAKSAKAMEGMLLRLMKHLRATGEDVFVVLKDNELQSWWQEKLKEILKEEAKQAAMEKAMATLSEEERRALGLKF